MSPICTLPLGDCQGHDHQSCLLEEQVTCVKRPIFIRMKSGRCHQLLEALKGLHLYAACIFAGRKLWGFSLVPGEFAACGTRASTRLSCLDKPLSCVKIAQLLVS